MCALIHSTSYLSKVKFTSSSSDLLIFIQLTLLIRCIVIETVQINSTVKLIKNTLSNTCIKEYYKHVVRSTKTTILWGIGS